MKMDYTSLKNKAAYFELIQGENYLLEQQIKEEMVGSVNFEE